MSVLCIELLHWVHGPLGYVRVYVHGLLHTWGFGKRYKVWGLCAEGYTGIQYRSLTRDWCYEFVKLL